MSRRAAAEVDEEWTLGDSGVSDESAGEEDGGAEQAAAHTGPTVVADGLGPAVAAFLAGGGRGEGERGCSVSLRGRRCDDALN